MPAPTPTDRVALVTGVSRRAGIGFAIARRLLADGFLVVIHSWVGGDRWVGSAGGHEEVGEVIAGLGGLGDRLAHVEADFFDERAAGQVVTAAVARFGALDVLVANHAAASSGDLFAVTAADLDHAWAVNARASVLLTQAFAAAFDPVRGQGRVVLFTSGQHLGPMSETLAYAVSKGAIHQMTASLADTLASRGITVNAVNPGPVDTGWPSDELRASLTADFPLGRWGSPDDIAPVVSWLASPESGWMTGQVLNTEGGFRR
jgi:3-oxoacyl-[acyl-carrier protein] reductase